MEHILHAISGLSIIAQLLLFLVENTLLFAAALWFGAVLLRSRRQPVAKASGRDRRIAAGTVLINTVVTQLGFVLWQRGWIAIDFAASPYMVSDLLILFFAMDFLMYVFHLAIHHTFLYRYIHALHHEAVNPSPIDLFVLHPLETAVFGGMWLALLVLGHFNLWAICAYLVLNVVSGIAGHLGSTTCETASRNGWLRYLGTARFHHAHHQNVHCNFGFYTSLWDRLFGTYAEKAG